MKTNFIIFIMIVATAFSCSNSNKNKSKIDTQQENINETPQVFDEGADYSLSSIGKRYNPDIVSKLYAKAVEKNLKLKQLNDKINNISDIKNDSLYDYLKFSNTNNGYWSTVNRYIDDLQDSTLRESTREIFKEIELKYKAKMSNYDKKLTEINKKTIILNDQLILMKLLITEPMIRNYQINEKPNIEPLENIIDEYEKLIIETEKYLRNIKE